MEGKDLRKRYLLNLEWKNRGLVEIVGYSKDLVGLRCLRLGRVVRCCRVSTDDVTVT